jgi:hypothetical protein
MVSPDWCQGCADERKRPKDFNPTLRDGWIEGDVIPENVTRHYTLNEKRPFVYKYGRQERVWLV